MKKLKTVCFALLFSIFFSLLFSCADTTKTDDTFSLGDPSTYNADGEACDSHLPIDTDSDTGKGDSDQTYPDADKRILGLVPSDKKTLRIACIGDSITYGYGSTDPSVYSWPAQLQKQLEGENIIVGNFGKSSSYAMSAEDKYNVRDKALSYRATKEYENSLRFGADIVIIKLGINDCSNLSCKEACDNLKDALVSLAKEYSALSTVQRVYIATSIRVSITARAEQFTDGPLQDIQKAAAEEAGVSVMDVYGLTREYYDFMIHYTNDRLHPGNTTYTAIANAVYSILTEKAYVQPKINKAVGNVVYVSASGSKTNDGSSPQKAVSSIAVAVGLLRDTGGTVVLSGDYTVVSETHLPETHKPITITSVYNGINYGGAFRMKNSLYLGGEIKFEKIEFKIAATGIMFVCEYNDAHFASGIKCTLDSGVTQYPVIVAGYNVAAGGLPAQEVSLSGECSITVDSGTWLYLRGGNRRTNAAQPFGTVDKDAVLSITVNGGEFKNKATSYMTCATGMNAVAGKCVLRINGGIIRGNVYGVSRVGTSSFGGVAEVSGTVEVHINGGTIEGSVVGVMDSTAKFTGKCNLYLTNETHSLENKASGFSSIEKR